MAHNLGAGPSSKTEACSHSSDRKFVLIFMGKPQRGARGSDPGEEITEIQKILRETM